VREYGKQNVVGSVGIVEHDTQEITRAGDFRYYCGMVTVALQTTSP
jgi:hypothetical protein